MANGETGMERAAPRWQAPVDPDQFALAQLAVQIESYTEAEARLLALIEGDGPPALGNKPAGPAVRREGIAQVPVPFPVGPVPTLRDACLLLAEALYMSGRYEDCLAHCGRAVESGALPPDEPYAELLRGWILERHQQIRPALEIVNQHLRGRTGRLPGSLEACFLHLRGHCETFLGQVHRARRDLRDAVALYRQAGQSIGEAETLNALGALEYVAGRLPVAVAILREAMHLNERLGTRFRRAKSVHMLAIATYKSGRPAEALPLFDEARAVQEQRRCPQIRLNIDLGRAKALLMLGRADEARATATRVLGRAVAGRFPREEELALECLGDAALLQNRLAAVRRYHERALAVARSLGHPRDLVAGLERRLGELALAEEDACSAVPLLRRAVRHAGACHEKYEEIVAGRLLAVACRQLGQWSRAYSACRRALTRAREFGADLELARCRLEAARIRLGWWRRLQAGQPASPPSPEEQAVFGRSHLEMAWSYAVEAFHGFADLAWAEGCQACTELMDQLRAESRTPLGWPRSQARLLPARPPSAASVTPLDSASRAADSAGPALAPGTAPAHGIVCVASSPAMRRVLGLVQVAATSAEPVLIRGETGTGKELMARLVHAGGPRGAGPFVPVNCGAIPETLFEREFFGHRKGAFTGAESDRPGLVELAEGGTLLLDEIGDLPLYLQVKLLRLLQEGTFRRLGDPAERHADLRVIAASNADLPQLIAGRRFRQDLYYRLAVLEIELPPLRDRAEDIMPLVAHFLARAMGPDLRPVDLFAPEVLEAMRRYPWPGNVRELEAMVRRLALLAGHAGRATPEMLSPAVARWLDRPSGVRGALNLTRHLEQAERDRIVQALTHCEGNRTEAARALGISRNTLYKKMERLGIRIPP